MVTNKRVVDRVHFINGRVSLCVPVYIRMADQEGDPQQDDYKEDNDELSLLRELVTYYCH